MTNSSTRVGPEMSVDHASGTETNSSEHGLLATPLAVVSHVRNKFSLMLNKQNLVNFAKKLYS